MIARSDGEQSSDSEPLLLLYRASPLQLFFIATTLFSLLALLRMPVFSSFGTEIIGGTSGDIGLYHYLIRSNNRDLFSLPWFSTFAFYPYAGTLAWSDNFILPSWIAGALQHYGLTFAASYNAIILGAQFLNGFCTAMLALTLTGRAILAIFAGVAFMTTPFFTIHLGHPQLQFAFFIPLIAIFFFRAAVSNTLRYGLLIGSALFLSFLCSVYLTVFAVLLLFTMLGSLLLLRPRMFTLRQLLVLSVGAGIASLPTLPFALPYLEMKATFEGRKLYEAYYFSLSGISYLSSATGKVVFSALPFHGQDENNQFPGIVLLAATVLAFARVYGAVQLRRYAFALAAAVGALGYLSTPNSISRSTSLLAATVVAWVVFALALYLMARLGQLERKLRFQLVTDRNLIAVFLMAAIFFFVMSLGPLGNPEKGQWALAPYRLFYEIIPGVDGVRAVSRYALLVQFSLIMAATLVFAKRFPGERWIGAMVVMITLAFAEGYFPHVVKEAELPAPPVFSNLHARIKDGETFAVLPYAPSLTKNRNIDRWSIFATAQVRSMNWGFTVEQPFLNGYSGIQTRYMRDLPRELADFPNARSIIALRKIVGLKYVIFIPSFLSSFDTLAFMEHLKEMRGEISILETDGSGAMLFELDGAPTAARLGTLELPSSPQGELEIVLSPLKGVPQLDLFLDAHVPGTPIGSCRVEKPGTVCRVSIPQTSDRSRPLQLRLAGAGAEEVSVVETRWHPAHLQ